MAHYANEVIRCGAKTTVEEITDKFYFIVAVAIISGIAIHGQSTLSAKAGKPLEQRLEAIFSVFFKRTVLAAEYFELAKHPEALDFVPKKP